MPTTKSAKVQLVTNPAKHAALTDAPMLNYGSTEPFNETKLQLLLSHLARQMFVRVPFAVAKGVNFLATWK